MYDVLVVGGGPAGLAAATWLARYRRKVLVVDSREYRNRWVESSHGYLGSDGMSPAALREAARKDLGRYPYVELRTGCVSDLSKDGDWFVATVDGECVRALRVILATGVVDAFPKVEGFADHYGASVFHCPTCDGYEARDKNVVVLGWGEHIAGFALNLLDWAASVTVVTDCADLPEQPLAGHGVRVVDAKPEAFEGERGRLRGLRVSTGETIPCELAFFSVAHVPRNELAKGFGVELVAEGCLVVDEHGETKVPGLYAAGDLTPGMQLVQVAAASGAIAGIGAALSLRGEPGVPGSPPPGPDVEAVLEESD